MSQSIFTSMPTMDSLVPRYLEDKRWSFYSKLIWSGFLFALLIVLAIAANLVTDGIFLNGRNLANLLGHQILNILVCLPFAAILFARGGMDFSVGTLSGLAGMVFGLTFNASGAFTACVATLLVCMGFGLLNAGMVGFLRIPGVVVTLLTAVLMRAALLGLSGGQTIAVSLGDDPIILVVLWTLAILIFAGAIALGFWSKQSGQGLLRQAWQFGWPFLAMSLCAGLMGIVTIQYVQNATLAAGNGVEFKILGAVVLGGTWFCGRRPNFIGLVLALLIFASLNNFMNLANVPLLANMAVTILIILVSLGVQIGFHAIVGYFYKKRFVPQKPQLGES